MNLEEMKSELNDIHNYYSDSIKEHKQALLLAEHELKNGKTSFFKNVVPVLTIVKTNFNYEVVIVGWSVSSQCLLVEPILRIDNTVKVDGPTEHLNPLDVKEIVGMYVESP